MSRTTVIRILSIALVLICNNAAYAQGAVLYRIGRFALRASDDGARELVRILRSAGKPAIRAGDDVDEIFRVAKELRKGGIMDVTMTVAGGRGRSIEVPAEFFAVIDDHEFQRVREFVVRRLDEVEGSSTPILFEEVASPTAAECSRVIELTRIRMRRLLTRDHEEGLRDMLGRGLSPRLRGFEWNDRVSYDFLEGAVYVQKAAVSPGKLRVEYEFYTSGQSTPQVGSHLPWGEGLATMEPFFAPGKLFKSRPVVLISPDARADSNLVDWLRERTQLVFVVHDGNVLHAAKMIAQKRPVRIAAVELRNAAEASRVLESSAVAGYDAFTQAFKAGTVTPLRTAEDIATFVSQGSKSGSISIVAAHTNGRTIPLPVGPAVSLSEQMQRPAQVVLACRTHAVEDAFGVVSISDLLWRDMAKASAQLASMKSVSIRDVLEAYGAVHAAGRRADVQRAGLTLAGMVVGPSGGVVAVAYIYSERSNLGPRVTPPVDSLPQTLPSQSRPPHQGER